MEQYIQPFVQVTTSIFKELVHCDIVPERAYFVGKDSFLAWDLSGLIALTGEVKGMVAISMKTTTASKITTILTKLPDPPPAVITDAIGEVVNIIAGNAKKYLEEMFKIIISLPTVIRGKAHMVAIPDERTRLLCIPFTIFDGETISLSINID
ncbi:MAG: chemotaxis protein CheX [Treponema sp.]|jgi:chemotaxis protein CheX|nr:chemotaxis protein CheX [Treponema sp.]